MAIKAYPMTPLTLQRAPHLAGVDVVLEFDDGIPAESGRNLLLTAGEARTIIAELHQATRPALAGKSPIDLLWEELDSLMSELMASPSEEGKGHARGVAYALAVLSNPYAPDVDAIRAEAMRRYEEI